ncbi:MAG TPA: hypothetical protein DD716_07230 [Thiomicrospira sp.]|jgi:Ca-activated chloride channel family protein|nr:hypothetical protein [Thiomicrospira sp.]
MSSFIHETIQFISSLSQVEFLEPWVLALLPLPWILRLLIKPVAKVETPLLAPHILQRLNRLTNHSDYLIQPNSVRHSLPGLAIIMWLLVVLAAMRPVLFIEPTSFTASGKDLILAVDLSGSMEKNDMILHGKKVDRLTSVKSVVADFIEQRQGDRLGLVVFGSQAFIQSPLTHDLTTLNQLLQETEIGMAGNNTAIGDAIGLTLKHLANQTRPSKVKPILILLTDGSNTDGKVDPIDAAKKAKEMGLKIYTIGIGKARLSSIDAFLNRGRHMDIDTLKTIAEISGGEFFLASDSRQLNKIYQHINQLELSEHQIYQYRLRTELYPWLLGAALIISFLIAISYLIQLGGFTLNNRRRK